MMAVPTFVDMQGFFIGKHFILKEVAILSNGGVLAHYIFTNPIPWSNLTIADKRRNLWLIKNYHGLSWTQGFTPFIMARTLILDAIGGGGNTTYLYVKGCEKRLWLMDILNDSRIRIKTIDADYEDIPSLQKLHGQDTFHCSMHYKNCALKNVFKLYNWWNKYQ